MGEIAEKKPAILAVDDEKEFIDMLKQYFELRGYDIDVAYNGIDGVARVKARKYEVVLLDLKMAGMNGDAAMKNMKELDPDARIIVISAFSDSGKTQYKVMEEGAFAYIEKPISSLKDLEVLVKKAIDGHGPIRGGV